MLTQHPGIIRRVPIQQLRIGLNILDRNKIYILSLLIHVHILLDARPSAFHEHEPVSGLLVATVEDHVGSGFVENLYLEENTVKPC